MILLDTHATALTMNIPLVTIDQKIRAYPHVRTIW